MTPNGTLNYLKMSLGSPPVFFKVGPRTPSSQTSCGHLEPKWLQKGVHFEAKIDSKIVLISGVEKVGDLEGPRVAKWTLETSKSLKTIGGVANFSFSHFSLQRRSGNTFLSILGPFLYPFGDRFETQNPDNKLSSEKVVKSCRSERTALSNAEGNARMLPSTRIQIYE